MRVAIIGGGFFGIHIARQIERRYGDADIDIFEREAAPLLGAGSTNQCRLHMGFHYPRSGYTIYQSIMGFDRFAADYGDFLEDVSDNLYAVERNGLVTVEEYLAVMDSFHLRYERVPVTGELFARPQDIGLLIRVPEKSIDVRRLRERMADGLRARILTGLAVDEIDAVGGFVRRGMAVDGPYDAIVNATYTDPNLGLPEEQHFGIKWELAAMLLARTTLPSASAVTIMDGEYVSVYPAYGGLHTLSSVSHTPMRRYADLAALKADYPRRFEIAEREGVAAAISAHVREHLRIAHDDARLWVTAKAKLATDMGDSRVTEVRRHERLFSVLCGKIDAVFEASDKILREISAPAFERSTHWPPPRLAVVRPEERVLPVALAAVGS